MVFVFLLSFLTYLITAYPTVSVGDSGELITAAYTLGIPHPPGYPLWTLLGKIFTEIIPFGNIAYRINLMSAFFGALTCAIVYLILRDIGTQGHRDAGKGEFHYVAMSLCPYLAALCLAFSKTFWSQSIIAEVYTLNTFFLVLLIYLIMKMRDINYRYEQRDTRYEFKDAVTPISNLQSDIRLSASPPPDDRRAGISYLYLFAFIYGLSLANHFIMFLFGPAFLLYIIWQNPKILNPKTILSLILFSVLGIFFYIYLPVRSSFNPPIDWGNPETFRNFIAHIGRFQYRGLEFAGNVGISTKFLFIKNFLRQFIQNFGIGLVIISIIGLFVIVKRNIKFAVFTILVVLINTLGLIILLNFKFTPQDIDAFTPYYLPAWIMVSMWVGFAGLWLAGFEKIRFGLLVVFLILLLNFMTNFKKNCNRYNFIAYDYPVDILKSIPKNGKLYLHEEVDETIFTLSYLKNVLEKRQDVSVIDSYGNIFSKGGFSKKETEFFSAVNTEKIKKTLILHGLIWTDSKKISSNPWFSYSSRLPQKPESYREQEVSARYPYFYGKFLIAENRQKDGIAELKKSLKIGSNLIWLNNNVGDILRQHRYFNDAYQVLDKTISLDYTYSPAYYNLGLLYLQKQFIGYGEEKAIEHFKKAYQYDKSDTDSLHRISKIYQNRGYKNYTDGEIGKAIAEYKKAAEFAPDKADIYYNIGVIHSQFGNRKDAKEFFKKYLEIKPGGKSAKTVKKWLENN